MSRGMIGLAVAAFVLGLGTGCGSAPKKQIELTPLDCSLAGKPKVVKKSISGATIEIPMRAINNNPIAVRLDKMALDATINGNSIGSCEPIKGIVIGTGKTSELRLTYHASTLGGGLAVVEAIATGNLTSEVSGTAHIAAAEAGYVGDKEFPLQAK